MNKILARKFFLFDLSVFLAPVCLKITPNKLSKYNIWNEKTKCRPCCHADASLIEIIQSGSEDWSIVRAVFVTVIDPCNDKQWQIMMERNVGAVIRPTINQQAAARTHESHRNSLFAAIRMYGSHSKSLILFSCWSCARISRWSVGSWNTTT